MDKRNLEGTRLDKITLQDIEIIGIRDMTDLSDRGIIVSNSTATYYETESGQIFSSLKIEKDEEIHLLRAGGTGYGKSYCTLQTGIYNPESGNLICNTVDDYHRQIARISVKLDADYGIVADFERAKLKTIEINRTFRITYPFADYGRVIRLILTLMPYMTTISTFGHSAGGKSDIATYSASSRRGGKSKQYRIISFYDKSKQISGLIQLNGEYMRVEMRIVGTEKIEKELGTAILADLTDDMIGAYFERQINSLIVQPIQKWRANRNKQLLRLMEREREADCQNWQVNVLRTLANKELENDGIPVLLDVSELDRIVDQMDIPRRGRVKANFRKQAEKHESVFCRSDNKKLDEIIDALLAATPAEKSDDLVAGREAA